MSVSAVITPLFVAVPLGAAFLTALLARRWGRLADGLGLTATFVAMGMAFAALGLAQEGRAVILPVGGWAPPVGIAMVVDGLTLWLLVIVNLVAFVTALYSVNYMRAFTAKWQFHTLFLLMLAGMNGVVVTGDLFNLYVFLEIAAVASYALVAFGTERHELEAAFKYAIMSTLGSLSVLLGIAILYSSTSTLNMADMARELQGHEGSGIPALAGVLFVAGFGLKAALVPFHAWLPDAHPSAPAPISAMLSGVFIKSLGVYALCRVVFNVLGAPPLLLSVLLALGALSMVVGVFLAVGQWDLKRLLAYHSISQIGYVVLGIGLATPLGLLGGLFHLFNHSIFKSLLFLNAGSVEWATGTRDLRQMGGLGRQLPVTSGTTLVASMSIAGIPPFNGFWSKLIIIVAAVEAGRYGYAVCAVVVSVLTLASFMKVLKYAFLGPTPDIWKGIREVPFLMKTAMLVLAAICVGGGLLLLPGVGEPYLAWAVEVLEPMSWIAEMPLEEGR
ncbi:MAG: proton-conducting transporter membrane subunit [Candidatus Hydrogenedentota bacterium]